MVRGKGNKARALLIRPQAYAALSLRMYLAVPMALVYGIFFVSNEIRASGNGAALVGLQ